ncbi:MAG: SOS response-associated peptidase [Armatimonadetes bacterium]|nr:SOS response-associated peptidase [Armatimonadota bacterium]
MCARFAFFSGKIIKDEFGITAVPDLALQYNIAPTDVVPIVLRSDGARTLRFQQWGLVPSWAKDPAMGNKMINARAETLSEKPTFRAAFKARRCLVPCNGFFEWTGKKGSKQPHYVHMRSGDPFALAGLWEYWEGVNGALETFTIITTTANELVSKLHNRMPVIIERRHYDEWLGSFTKNTDRLQRLLAPFSSEQMRSYPVSSAMNSLRLSGPECIARVSVQETLTGLAD